MLNRQKKDNHLFWYLIFLFALLVYATGIQVTLMEPDAAAYADVAMEMVQRKNFLETYLRGTDWLDKPHFQFWITSVSYQIFGINNFGYKFPAIIFSLIAILYTLLFGKRFYSLKHGVISAVILMTAEHFILSNNDVRAEPYLAGMTIFSLYYFVWYLKEKRLWHLVLGLFGLGLLLMTKGIYTILPVASALGLSLLLEKNWKEIFHIQWIWVIFITLFINLPVMIGYYIQFDLHPEKVIFGQTHFSGIRFYLWDSQWGRFTNTGPIKGEGDLFFYIHTMLWSFAPWAFLFIYGFIRNLYDLIRQKNSREHYVLLGFLFVFILFSISSFQLPHYLNQVFPLMAIITSTGFLKTGKARYTLKFILFLQIITLLFLGTATILLQFFFFDGFPRIDVTGIVVLSWGISLYFFMNERSMLKRILIPPALFILSINYYLNRQFYPHLVTYQSESQIAFYMLQNNLPIEQLVFYEENEWATDFYLKRVMPEYKMESLKSRDIKGRYIFTSEYGLQDLRSKNFDIEIIKMFSDFHITTLNLTFLNKKTRNTTLQKKWLVYVR